MGEALMLIGAVILILIGPVSSCMEREKQIESQKQFVMGHASYKCEKTNELKKE